MKDDIKSLVVNFNSDDLRTSSWWDRIMEDLYYWYRTTWMCRSYWWFIHRFVKRHKYNTIYTELPPGYYDPDDQILWGVMGIVERYVREGLQHFAEDETHAKLEDIVIRWNQYKQWYMFDQWDDAFDLFFKREQDWNAVHKADLQYIMEIRPTLWYA